MSSRDPDTSDDAQLRDVAASVRGTFRTAEELATAFMREAIIRGMYRPGERLHQESIAALLGLSRMPIRAGLRQLELEGLVSIQPHRSARVTSLSASGIREIYEIRGLMECYLIDQLVPRVTDDALANLRERCKSFEAAPAAADTFGTRVAFYDELYAIAQSPRAHMIVKRLRSEVDRYLLAPRRLDETHRHLALLDALEGRDARAAKHWLRHHLALVSERIAEALGEGTDAGTDAHAREADEHVVTPALLSATTSC